MSHFEKMKITAEEQWDQFRSGSVDSFTSIYNEHIKILLSYGRKIYNDRQVVADVVQELFTNLWIRKEFIGSTNSVKFYLFKSLRTALVKEIKKNQNKEFKLDNTETKALMSSSHEALVIQEERVEERQKLVKRALDLLSKREQEILYLKYFCSLGNDEISKLLSIQYQSVKNTSFGAIKKLRKYFSLKEIQVLLLAFAVGTF